MEKDNFIQAFDDFLIDRILAVQFKDVIPKYAKLDEKFDELFNQLAALLPPQGDQETSPKSILIDFSDTHSEILTATNEYSYRKGFTEGIKFIINSILAE